MFRLFVLIPMIVTGCFEVNLDQPGQDPPWLTPWCLGSKIADRDALVRSPDTTLVNLRKVCKTVEILAETSGGCGGLNIGNPPNLDDAQIHTSSLDGHLAFFREAVGGQISFVVEDVSLLSHPMRTSEISARPLGELLHEFLKQNECEFVILSSGDVLIRKLPFGIETPDKTASDKTASENAAQHTAPPPAMREAGKSSTEKQSP